MHRRVGPALLALLFLSACATGPEGGSLSRDAGRGGAVTAVLGTPFFAVFKAASCVVSTVIVLPSSAALALTDRPSRVGEREALHAGLGRNCFGSYLLWPT